MKCEILFVVGDDGLGGSSSTVSLVTGDDELGRFWGLSGEESGPSFVDLGRRAQPQTMRLGRGARRDVSASLMTKLKGRDTQEVERRSTSGAYPSLGVERREDSL